MMHELHVYWIMFWNMNEWLQAPFYLAFIVLLTWITGKLNTSKGSDV